MIPAFQKQNIINTIAADIRQNFRGRERELFPDGPERKRYDYEIGWGDFEQAESLLDNQVGEIARTVFEEGQNSKHQAIQTLAQEKRKPTKNISPELALKRLPHIQAARRRAQSERQARIISREEKEARRAQLRAERKKGPAPESRFTFKLDPNQRCSKSHIFALTSVNEINQLLTKSTKDKEAETKEAIINAVIKYFHPGFLRKVLALKYQTIPQNTMQNLIEAKYQKTLTNKKTPVDPQIEGLAKDIELFFHQQVNLREENFKEALIEDFNISFAAAVPKWLIQGIAVQSKVPMKIRQETARVPKVIKTLRDCLNPGIHKKIFNPLRNTLMAQIEKFRSIFNLKEYEKHFFDKAQNLLSFT